MLRYAIIFFVIALTAGVLGFSGITAGAVGIARILFVIFIVLFIAAAVHARPERQSAIGLNIKYNKGYLTCR